MQQLSSKKKSLTKTSKFISLILRHKPETIDLKLDSKGRVKINELIKAMNAHGHSINRAILDEIVENNDKKRFVIDGDYIYAAQGHSIKNVDIELEEKIPPKYLYHGTARNSVDSIFKNGINPRYRNHVHLSVDMETATKVGSRHGSALVLIVDALRMHVEGKHKFYLSKNDVWLTDYVPKEFITIHHTIPKSHTNY